MAEKIQFANTPSQVARAEEFKEVFGPAVQAAVNDPTTPVDQAGAQQTLESMSIAASKSTEVRKRIVTNRLTFWMIVTFTAATGELIADVIESLPIRLSTVSATLAGWSPNFVLMATSAIPIVSRFKPEWGDWLASFFQKKEAESVQ